MDEQISRYHSISKPLVSMIEDYKTTPSTFLKKKIELAGKQLKQIDAAIGKHTTPFGNYNRNPS